jgi:hypothetical protein
VKLLVSAPSEAADYLPTVVLAFGFVRSITQSSGSNLRISSRIVTQMKPRTATAVRGKEVESLRKRKIVRLPRNAKSERVIV